MAHALSRMRFLWVPDRGVFRSYSGKSSREYVLSWTSIPTGVGTVGGQRDGKRDLAAQLIFHRGHWGISVRVGA